MAARFADIGEPRRRWPRAAPQPLTVELACAGGGPTVSATLLDVSTFGCRLGGATADDVGDHVRIQLAPGNPASATVAWRHDGVIGCRFDKPIPTALMRALLGAAG